MEFPSSLYILWSILKHPERMSHFYSHSLLLEVSNLCICMIVYCNCDNIMIWLLNSCIFLLTVDRQCMGIMWEVIILIETRGLAPQHYFQSWLGVSFMCKCSLHCPLLELGTYSGQLTCGWIMLLNALNTDICVLLNTTFRFLQYLIV